MTLIDRLTAAIDATEAKARAVPGDLRQEHWTHPGPWIMHGTTSRDHEEIAKIADGVPAPIAEKLAEHIADNDPSEVIRTCQAHRDLIDLYRAAGELYDRHATAFDSGITCGLWSALKIIASVYDIAEEQP